MTPGDPNYRKCPKCGIIRNVEVAPDCEPCKYRKDKPLIGRSIEFTKDQLKKIFSMKKGGASLRGIGMAFKVSGETIRKVLKTKI